MCVRQQRRCRNQQPDASTRATSLGGLREGGTLAGRIGRVLAVRLADARSLANASGYWPSNPTRQRGAEALGGHQQILPGNWTVNWPKMPDDERSVPGV